MGGGLWGPWLLGVTRGYQRRREGKEKEREKRGKGKRGTRNKKNIFRKVNEHDEKGHHISAGRDSREENSRGAKLEGGEVDIFAPEYQH